MKISCETFIYQIDKFLSREKNFVCIALDSEYDQFLEKEKQELDDLEKMGEELDDYFLEDDKPKQ
jgi:hypothetical protein